MVVFTCNHCGDSLQKPKVAKHYQFQCRKNPDLTCVDCHKDYRGEEYKQHTQCVTEDQRYGGQDYIAKPSSNKGERKQNDWINIVQNVLNNDQTLMPQEKNFLNQIAHYQNIPRKKTKFFNFIKSSMGNKSNWKIVESVWDKMESAFKESKSNTSDNQGTQQKKSNDTISNSIECSAAENDNNDNIAKECSNDTETLIGEAESETNKKKKRKAEDNNESAEFAKKNNIHNENADKEVSKEVVENKKKSKKRKLEQRNDDILANGAEPSEENVQKKKKKKNKPDENGHTTESEKRNELETNSQADLIKQSEDKKEKKKRKKKDEGTANEEEPEKQKAMETSNQEIQNLEADKTDEPKEKKKKKKNKDCEMKMEIDEIKTVDSEKSKISMEEAEEAEIKTEKKKKKKNKSLENNTEVDKKLDENGVEGTAPEIKDLENAEKFDWKKTVIKVLLKKDGTISLKKLQKKVVGSYMFNSNITSEKREDKAIEKFEKTLKKMNNILIENETVKIVNN